MQITHLEQFKKMPWKNGGGITHEYKIYPPSCSVEDNDFQWRVSVAEVKGSGEFSQFPLRERWLALWRGPTIEIVNQKDHEKYLLDETPWHFSGEEKLHYQQVIEPMATEETSWDLGLIYNPVTIQSQMHKGILGAKSTLKASFDTELFFILNDSPVMVELLKDESYELKNQDDVHFYQLCLTFK